VRQAVCIFLILFLIGVPTLQAGGCGFCFGLACDKNQEQASTTCQETAFMGCHQAETSPSCSPCRGCAGNKPPERVTQKSKTCGEIKSCRYRCNPDECDFLEIPSLIGDKPTPTSGQDIHVNRPALERLRDCPSLIAGERQNPINVHIIISSTFLRC